MPPTGSNRPFGEAWANPVVVNSGRVGSPWTPSSTRTRPALGGAHRAEPITQTMHNQLSLVAIAATVALAGSLAAQGAPPPPVKAVASPKVARTLKGARQHQRLARPAFGPTRPHQVGPLTAAELERNDSIGFADALGAQPDFDGDITLAGDTDWVRCDVTATGVVTFDVSQTGTTPIPDATLTIRDAAGQFVAFNDDRPTSFMPLLVLPLPAGTYYAGVQGFAGTNTGTYKLTVTTAPTAFAPVNLGGATAATVPAGGGEVALQLILPTASAVRLNITANGGMDMYCAVLRQTGAVHRFVDDGVTGSVDPSLDIQLPAGIYLLAFGDFNAAGGAFTFNTTATAGAIPPIACGATVTGTVTGSESQNLFSLTLAAATNVDLATQLTGLSDSIVTVYDRDLNTITYNDDNNNVLASLVNMSLPAGQYYVGVEPFGNNAGGYSLVNTCSAFASTLARFGRNSGALLGGDSATLALDVGTPCPVELFTPLPAVLFPMTAILDASGLCVAYTDFGDFDLLGARATGGQYFCIVRDYFNQAGAYDADIGGQLFFPAPTKGALTMQDKVGQIQFLFAAVAPLVGFPVPAPFTGNLLINPPLISLPALPITGNGVVSYPATFPDGSYLVQSLSVTVSPLGGAMTNVAR